jgi:hypothetical protein
MLFREIIQGLSIYSTATIQKSIMVVRDHIYPARSTSKYQSSTRHYLSTSASPLRSIGQTPLRTHVLSQRA